jgi:hypothetical protein
VLGRGLVGLSATGKGRERCLGGEARYLVGPEVFGADRVVRVALEEEVLEEAHVLEAE